MQMYYMLMNNVAYIWKTDGHLNSTLIITVSTHIITAIVVNGYIDENQSNKDT